MDGQLENPSRYSTLEGRCICVNAQELESLDRILYEAIDHFHEVHEQKGVKPLPREAILEYIKSDLLLLLVDDKYIVGLDVGSTWFSSEVYLMEEFVYRYGEGTATMKDVGKAISLVGKTLGCTRVRIGTLAAMSKLRHLALAKVYERAGFTFDAVTLTRNLRWD